MKHLRSYIILSLFLLFIGCSSEKNSTNKLYYSDVLNILSDTLWFTKLNTPDTEIITSYDRTGGNTDYNWFLSQEKGWCTLADLKGPGVLTRFWFTGVKMDQRFRFYFDDERKPRLDLTLDEMRNNHPWFPEAPANYHDSCWCSFVPIPYSKRLIVMTEDLGYKTDGSRPKIFYQINSTPLSVDVKSLSKTPSKEDKIALKNFANNWDTPAFEYFNKSDNFLTEEQETLLTPGNKTTIQELSGPAIIRNLEIELDYDKVASISQREALLRDLILNIYWDEGSGPSVNVPIGDFFGSIWQRTRFQTRYFGMTNNVFNNQLPMPFSSKARFEIENKSSVSVPVRVKVSIEPLQNWDSDLGLLHASWHRSSALGQPHKMLYVKGKGKYVGCILSVTGYDKSWWVLESDEIMYRDHQTDFCWHGTGLEDYFNSSWYYKNVYIKPLHGLLFKAPFRTVQYRMHGVDPVSFNTSFNVIMERGPENASSATLENIAFFYLAEATSVESDLLTRAKPKSNEEKSTLLTELCNLERLNDYTAAKDAISVYLDNFPNSKQKPMLQLRQIATIERIQGFSVAEPLYKEFITNNPTDSLAVSYAKKLLWFHEDKSNVLVSLYCKNPTAVYIDSKKIAETGNPKRLYIFQTTLEQGSHCMALKTKQSQYPNWVQASVRSHSGLFTTDNSWRFAFGKQPNNDWQTPNYDDTQWDIVGNRYFEGPPPVPYIWTEPHPFVDMQSKAIAVWSSKWPDNVKHAIFRKEFTIP